MEIKKIPNAYAMYVLFKCSQSQDFSCRSQMSSRAKAENRVSSILIS